jgi:hypothetical protein
MHKPFNAAKRLPGGVDNQTLHACGPDSPLKHPESIGGRNTLYETV